MLMIILGLDKMFNSEFVFRYMRFWKWWFVPIFRIKWEGIESQCKFILKKNRKAKVKAKRVGKVNKNKGKGDQREKTLSLPFLFEMPSNCM